MFFCGSNLDFATFGFFFMILSFLMLTFSVPVQMMEFDIRIYLDWVFLFVMDSNLGFRYD